MPTSHRSHAQAGLTVPDRARSPLGPRPSRGALPTRVPRIQVPAASTGTPALTYARPGLSEREITVLRAWLDCDSKLGVATRPPAPLCLADVRTNFDAFVDAFA